MIQTTFNGMITFMMAKLILNDIPHASGLLANPDAASDNSWDNVWKSCVQAAKILGKELTEQVIPANWPELRRLHRDLWAQVYARGKLKSGSSSHNPRLERTTTDKILDDLERTWHRVEHDMSYDMQSALGILKEVMGYYYEEPCVAAWDNSNLIGVAVYEVGRDVNLQIDYTHIKELASFTHKPGVGKMLVDEVIRIARENACDEVNVSHGAGARGFYEKLGFKLYEGVGGETGTLMTYLLE